MSTIELIDCHTHSAYSGHGEGLVADMVKRAQELGLTTFVQSEHLILPEGMDPTFESSLSPDEMGAYKADLAQEKRRLAEEGSPLELICGIEADWLEGRGPELEELCASFEYVLGSVHFIQNRPFDDSRDLSVWDDLGVDGVWRAYLDAWLDMVEYAEPFTAFSHPDLAKKYGWYPSFDLASAYRDMAEAVAASQRMVEVNTSGLRKGAKEAYPSSELLAEFARAGVDCTVGSDAHAPADVAANILDAYKLMRQAGYRRVTVPTANGDRRYIPLDDL